MLKNIWIQLSGILVILTLLGLFWFGYDTNTSKISSQRQNWLENVKNTLLQKPAGIDKNECVDWSKTCPNKIRLVQVDSQGVVDSSGTNYAIIFDPKSPGLDFKVNVPLSNDIYELGSNGKPVTNFTNRLFEELIVDKNSLLDNKKPFAAINSDYIDSLNNPQGLDISRGVDYSGIFAKTRSSFAISGGDKTKRSATIQIGPRAKENDNYNAVGGNGRFYTAGVFKDICADIGQKACSESTNRSMAIITSTGIVIFLVHQSTDKEKLLPSQFQPLLEALAANYNLGKIQDGMLFDGGSSPGIFYDGKIYAKNNGPIGSVFLIYKS
ncbi:MAG: hypothetical protein WCK98_06075 [bacterium]